MKENKLIEVQSIHEQREDFTNAEVIIKKGVWIEILEFNPDTEQVCVNHRWEVESVGKKEEKGKRIYRVICKVKDVEKDNDAKKVLAKKVLQKHSNKLKASFAKALIDGVDYRSVLHLKNILNKLEEK
ncbi:hypothetical protein LCGC14_0556730 [marine sediment metagenome]|uniref:Phage protein n=1 Tax=marine sediment metagenome TaxID=412755 RepID=A0A0F9RN89_9ZZZZ